MHGISLLRCKSHDHFYRYLSELTSKIESRKSQLSHLESQRSEAKNAATKDARSLERQKLGHLKRLEEVSKTQYSYEKY